MTSKTQYDLVVHLTVFFSALIETGKNKCYYYYYLQNVFVLIYYTFTKFLLSFQN